MVGEDILGLHGSLCTLVSYTYIASSLQLLFGQYNRLSGYKHLSHFYAILSTLNCGWKILN